MQVGDGGLPGGPEHGFGGDGPCRRAIGGGTSSAMHRQFDAICRGLVNCSLVNPQSVSDSDFEDEGGGGGAATPRTVKLKPRDATVFEVDEPSPERLPVNPQSDEPSPRIVKLRPRKRKREVA